MEPAAQSNIAEAWESLFNQSKFSAAPPPGVFWRSPATGAKYPVTWRMALAGTVYMVRARVHEQEMDGSHGVGDVFWEGLSDLLDTNGRVMGSVYLEMSGYVPETGP